MPHQYLYLHGFASSPQSTKARELASRFAQLGLDLDRLDLNQDDFTHLTLTRQLQQVADALPPASAPVTIIGSSFGGLTAAWAGERHPQIQRLVLMAPAFGFLSHWLPRLGEAQLHQWQTEGYLSVYHYSAEQRLPLHYQFVEDAMQYEDVRIQRPIPTLILHGRRDDVIPIAASADFARSRPWVRLIELDSDHALTDVSDQIWQEISTFCNL
ncbi:YqiA/YcfP family alpha/beta fold hydrolase [Pantanalinema sp. GBBB05]|uniref:YqiA/YcfP family alpha/beta fold hydrolase n=1 Tax=Pantanalinema sp. GBBB05 TaxID=2604139 RepID=UPI001DD00F79|nr:alpha/beta fold hydrolase [Pantanalinema sp. GBBB05]